MIPSPCRFLRLFAVPVTALLLFTACPTVQEPDYVDPPSEPAVSATLEEPAGLSLKRRVAIARFSNETTYGKSVLLGDKRSLIGRTTSDLLATRLTESGRFLLFERTDPEKVAAALEAGDLTPLNIPAEYLIVGSLSEFGRDTTGETGVFSRTKKQRAYAKVNIRLIEVATARVIYAEEGSGEAFTEAGTVMGVGTKAGYDSSLDSKAISAAISKLVSNLVENLMAQPWRSYVLGREGDLIIIGGGASQGLAPGRRLNLVRKGRQVTNPQTGLPMNLPGDTVAELEVASLFGEGIENEGAFCRVISGTVPGGDDFSNYVVEEPK